TLGGMCGRAIQRGIQRCSPSLQCVSQRLLQGHLGHSRPGLRYGIFENASESIKRSRSAIPANTIRIIRTKPQFDPFHSGKDVDEVFSRKSQAAWRRKVVMKDPKSTVRYLGFHASKDGARKLDFSFSEDR